MTIYHKDSLANGFFQRSKVRLKGPDYERLAPAYELRRKLIEIRLEAGFTQEQMADALKTQKSNISRLENVNSKISPKLSTIERYANAAGYRLEIKFVPETHSSSQT
jgi:DNA-binding XRE family transcriptional regulator